MSNSQHKSPDRATEAVERLLLVTLALEESLRDEQFVESSVLFCEREAILEELQQLVLTPKAQVSVSRVQKVEKQILGFLTDWRTATMKTFDDGRTHRKATTTYLAAVSGAAFSMDGKH